MVAILFILISQIYDMFILKVSLKLAVPFNVTFALRAVKIDSDFKIILFQSK